MSEQSKKDLTGVFELGQSMEQAGVPFPSTPGMEYALETPEPEAIDSFESLEEYQANSPEHSTPPSGPEYGSDAPPFEMLSEEEHPIEALDFEEPAPLPAPEMEIPVPADLSVEFPASPELPEPQSELLSEPIVSPPTLAHLEPPVAVPKPALDTMGLLKEFAERVPVGKPVVAAAFPFSLRIEGALTAEEKEKLIDLLNRENMGIREVDLEPQLQANRILIPRISEYAAILLVQALRGIQAEMRIGPSDSIYSTAETRTPEDENAPLPRQTSEVFGGTEGHAAESLPITTLSFLPELPHFSVIEVLTSSASLKSQVVEAESSGEYQAMLDSLQREIRYKAFHKGATAVVNYTVTLTTLNLPSHYRLTATGSAIRPKPFV